MSHQVETAAAPPQRRRRGARSVEWTLIIAISFSILSLLKLEPIANNSVQNHVSEFDLPQTQTNSHLVGIQHFQSSETLSSKSKTPNKAAHAATAAVEQVGSKETETEDGGEPVETPLTQTQMQTSPQSQNVHFRTYGNDNYDWAKGRIVQEALDTGWFASVKALGPDDLTAEFKKRFENILKLRRGGGYWIWKYDVIEQTLVQMKEGDFLVYLDAGSQVNKDGEERFREYLKIVNESEYDMLCFEYRKTFNHEYKWTTENVFNAFNVSMEDPIRRTGQIEGGTLLMQKGPHLRSWLKIIQDALLQDPWIITDKYNHETELLTPDFRDNRHDQSISSVSRKIHGCEMLNAYVESNSGASDKPFHVKRLKKPPRGWTKPTPPQKIRPEDACTFCTEGLYNQSLVVPRTGGNSCGSLKKMAAGHMNGSDICGTLQKEERVCCLDIDKSAVGSKGGGGTIVEVSQVQVDTSLPSWNISAIIPACNRLHSLQDAIDSALKQTYPVSEVIVSIDSGPNCVKSIKNIWGNKDDRVRVFKLPPCPQNPCGAGPIRNYAIENASPYATHFAMLDDDDVWYPQKTEIQVKAMHEGNYSYASSDANKPRNGRCHGSKYISHDLEKGAFSLANGGRFKKLIWKKLNIPPDASKLPSHITEEVLSAHNIFVNSATIFSKDIFYATSGFNPSGSEDYDLWLEFAKISPGLFITDPLVVYDNIRNGCDMSYTSDLYDDAPPDIEPKSPSASRNESICTFCTGGIFNQRLVVPRTGGNTCGSLKSMAAGHMNGSDICGTLQKEERVCCLDIDKSAVGSKGAMVTLAHKYRWIDSKEAIVPLVEAFIGPRNSITQEMIYYQPSHNLSSASAESSQLPLGYSFPCNGQGGRRNNIFYPIDRLEYRLEPTGRIFSKNEAIACFQSKAKWIHIDGDSLSRDVLYDITELFGMGWNEKKKALGDMEFTTGIRTTFSGNTIKISPRPNWVESIQMDQTQPQDCPDIWIYSSGLWDHPANTSETVYRKRTQALADYSNYSCVPYKILRYTTPYQKQKSLKNLNATNAVTMAYNAIAAEILAPKGFHVVNAYDMMESRGDLTHDGVHYTGPGSKWITNAILNIICPTTIAAATSSEKLTQQAGIRGEQPG